MSARIVALLILSVLTSPLLAREEQGLPPGNDRNGNAVAIIHNDATASITIETHFNGAWQALRIDAGKDGTISGDHIRISTTRADSAMITIDLPTTAGKKYRVFWNTAAGMWDFAVVADSLLTWPQAPAEHLEGLPARPF